jgi:Flp pilus assembly secretin CpaC
MRPSLCLTLLLPLTALAAQKEAAAAPQTLDLVVGAQFFLELPGVVKVAIGDSAVAEVKYLGKDEILVVGVGEGETTLKYWRRGEATPTAMKVNAGRKPTAATATDPQVTVKIGQKSTLDLPGITRIVVGDDQIADLKVIGSDKVVITGGKHVATTTVIVWAAEVRTSFLVHVVQ